MKKYLSLVIIMIFFVFQFRNSEETVTEQPQTLISRPLVLAPTAPRALLPPVLARLPQRLPSQISPSVPVRPVRRQDLVQRETDIPLQNGDWIAKNIMAVPTTQYTPQLGTEVYHDKHLTYFAGHSADAIPVAFDPHTQKFHAVSRILILKKINEETRQEILKEGHKEYYYHARMKLLQVESTTAEVLPLYQEFKNRGWDVQLEVLKESPTAH